jgi:hypothetical protein
MVILPDGNLILEHYDEATDTVTITTYSVIISKRVKNLFAIANRIFCFLTYFLVVVQKCLST